MPLVAATMGMSYVDEHAHAAARACHPDRTLAFRQGLSALHHAHFFAAGGGGGAVGRAARFFFFSPRPPPLLTRGAALLDVLAHRLDHFHQRPGALGLFLLGGFLRGLLGSLLFGSFLLRHGGSPVQTNSWLSGPTEMVGPFHG